MFIRVALKNQSLRINDGTLGWATLGCPSPRPSPLGRGRMVHRLSITTVPESTQQLCANHPTGACCSLSLPPSRRSGALARREGGRERVRVRENAPSQTQSVAGAPAANTQDSHSLLSTPNTGGGGKTRYHSPPVCDEIARHENQCAHSCFRLRIGWLVGKRAGGLPPRSQTAAR